MLKRGLIFSILVLFLISLVPAPGVEENESNTYKSKCEYFKGKWESFNNACADTCDYVRNPETILCAAVITDSCNCGEDKCWNGVKCEKNEATVYQKCDALNDCPDGQTCAKFEGKDSYCFDENLDLCLKCKSQKCNIAESYPLQVFCEDDESENKCSGYTYSNCPEDKGCIAKCVPSNCGEDYCTEDCDGKGSCYQKKVSGGIAVMEKIIPSQISNCPEECTCSGSTVKCELASGRTMTVTAGNSGNTIVQVKGTNISTTVNLFKDEGKIYGVFKSGEQKEIKVFPDEIEEKIKKEIQDRLQEKNITLDEEGYYQIAAKKKAKLFFMFPVKEKVKIHIDPETGNIIATKNSWWGFLARDENL